VFGHVQLLYIEPKIQCLLYYLDCSSFFQEKGDVSLMQSTLFTKQTVQTFRIKIVLLQRHTTRENVNYVQLRIHQCMKG